MGMLSRLKLLFTIGLTLFDMGSDIILAVDYYKTGQDWWWFTLTLTFFLLPVVVLALIGVGALLTQSVDPDVLKAWKVFECMVESGPQLILQLYIMALSDTNSVTQEDETNSTVVLNTTTELYLSTYETTTFNSSMNVTEQPSFPSSNDDISITLILQIITVITSLLSISWGATSFKAEDEETSVACVDPFEPTDYVMDLVWNILCISARILALSLFATVYRYWFAGIVTVHIIIIFSVMLYNMVKQLEEAVEGMIFIIFSLGLSMGYLFNILIVSYDRLLSSAFQTYRFYLCYWIVLMTETTILISIWYAENQDNDLWYRDVAIAFVIPAYFISVAIKTFHVSTLQQNKGKPIWKWVCTNIDMTDDEEQESEAGEGGQENNIGEPETQESVA